jgi:hypothetical protein
VRQRERVRQQVGLGEAGLRRDVDDPLRQVRVPEQHQPADLPAGRGLALAAGLLQRAAQEGPAVLGPMVPPEEAGGVGVLRGLRGRSDPQVPVRVEVPGGGPGAPVGHGLRQQPDPLAVDERDRGRRGAEVGHQHRFIHARRPP